MQQEKKLPSASAGRWCEKYSKRFVERQSKIRDRHFSTENNKILSAQSKFHDEIDVFLANSESFKQLKPRLMATPKTDNRHALIYFMAADWCSGSLDYLMRENENDGSEEVYSFEEEGCTENKDTIEENTHRDELTTFNKNSEDLDEETIEQVSAQFEEHFTTMQKWLNTDVNDPSEAHRFQTGMNYALTKIGGCTRRIIAMKYASANDLTTLSTDELNALRLKVEDEINTRKLRLYLIVQTIDVMFIIKADNIKAKEENVKDIFEKYGPGDLSCCNDNEISFCFRDVRDANDCKCDIDSVKTQLKRMLYWLK